MWLVWLLGNIHDIAIIHAMPYMQDYRYGYM